ncbi:uncharacterized protein BO97DRAFT_93947 [Aspergillus homomorphus CBS 101889]|uniref:Uncharacterized protein n=1 Tax=Aspergillus homomorphus (strain CBS 101889) TaxID=1450537 RepID=A0A395HW45_ASPHC|nr:hypothetical protein BO97DRAFT_93947 [Aspergillus homomorphus CBS 101889]RAL11746.1 hypothetical protein BO97DRAFT_93947 [Aspergillus homomorphus CBS 101889]
MQPHRWKEAAIVLECIQAVDVEGVVDLEGYSWLLFDNACSHQLFRFSSNSIFHALSFNKSKCSARLKIWVGLIVISSPVIPDAESTPESICSARLTGPVTVSSPGIPSLLTMLLVIFCSSSSSFCLSVAVMLPLATMSDSTREAVST